MSIRYLALFLLLCLPTSATTALAVCPDPLPQSSLRPGEVGLFFDAAGTVDCIDLAVGVPTPLYLVGRAPADGIGQYSIPWLSPALLPPGLTFFTSSLELPAGSLFEFGATADWCHQAFPLDPVSCAVEEGELVVLGVTTITAFGAVSGTAKFQTACPTFAGMRLEPVWYADCSTSAPRQLEGGHRLYIGFGEPPVAVDPTSWSTIKALFGPGMERR